jgi:hypothetical protein
MKYMRNMAKYTWQDYRTNEDILSELKINPAVKKRKITEVNGVATCSATGQRQTTTNMKYQSCGK